MRGGWRGATVTQGSELNLSLCWEAEGQGRGLKVPATTFPPTRHIFRWKKGDFLGEMSKSNLIKMGRIDGFILT